MNNILHTTPTRFIVAFTLVVTLLGTTVSAQSALQSSGGAIQSQTGQAQNSANTQNQTGTLQQNNGQTVLTQSGAKPLGVVSDPNQTTPQSVVQPSNTLKTDITKAKNSSTSWIVVVIIVATIIGISALFLYLNRSQKPVTKVVTTKPAKKVVIPELTKPVVHKKKKQTRRKRQKTAK